MDPDSSAGELIVKMLAAVADFERELIVERTKAGQAKSEADGQFGRPAKTTEEQRRDIARRLAAGESVSAGEAYKVWAGDHSGAEGCFIIRDA